VTTTLNPVRLAAVICLGLVSASLGQAPVAPRDSERPNGGGPAAFGAPRFAPPSFALKEALDTNHDNKISAAEIQAAAESLRKLDKNHDGILSAAEIGWPPRLPGFGPGGGPPGGGRGFPFGDRPFGDRGQAGRTFPERLMARDANRDGKITKEELPSSMQWLIPLGDRDNNGAIDKKEAQALAERLGIAASRPDPKPK
jgi:hypothetical protein